MIVECPSCGGKVDTDDCVYTTISSTDTHPMLMSYAPTCGVCGHKIMTPDLLCHPTLIPDAIMGGLMVFSIDKQIKRT